MKLWIKINVKIWEEKLKNGKKRASKKCKNFVRKQVIKRNKNKKKLQKTSSQHLILNLSSTKAPNLRKASKLKLPIWVTHVGNTITLLPKFKQGSIEVPKYWQDRSTTWQPTCGLWLAWPLKCWLDNYCSIQEKTTHKLSERMMIIWLKWCNFWVVSLRNSPFEEPSLESITANKELCNVFLSFKTGVLKMWWSQSTDSQTKMLNNLKTSCYQCFNAIHKKDS